MSRDLLTKLQGAQAFDPAPRQDELHLHHVPFDELAAGSRVEASWGFATQTPERVAVGGLGGQGKPSLTAYPTRTPQRIAPIRVPIFPNPAETVTEPKAFAQHF